ncbi:AEC family transporter [Arthrobacter sp. Br18]|uniref:AEC family transporter n=1 Tax=Arthrobacter sp. Br18 TaxID=1312954 RepID=UPI0004789DC8|nr:AEC family transporter [Arthrobacter sp. Br18]
MGGVLQGFLVIAAVIGVGFCLGKLGVLGRGAQEVLSRLVFFAGTPALLFVTLISADLADVVSPTLAVTAISTTLVAFIYAGIAHWALKRSTGDTVIGALSSSYVNAGNLGIPITVFVFGNAALVAPVMLFQVVVVAPVAYAILDINAKISESVGKRLLRPLRNPITIGSFLGMAVSGTGITVPPLLLEPVELVAGVAVPGALIAFGLSLAAGLRTAQPVSAVDLSLVTFLKLVVHPALAFLVGRFVFGMEAVPLLAVTLFAALPTAQNVLIAAIRYDRGRGIARQAALVTTALSVLPMIAIVALVDVPGF